MKLYKQILSVTGMVLLLGAVNLCAAGESASESNATKSRVSVSGNEKSVDEVLQNSAEIMDQISEYGSLIMSSLYFIVFGMIMIFILNKLVSKFLYPYMKNTRIIKVVFGTLYILILVVSILMVLKGLGFEVKVIGKIAILSVLVAAVAIFFIIPFLPRLPFKIGHMVEINGVMGIVDSITTYHTTIKQFDGTMVFLPNALVMASKIMNYNDIPERRISMDLAVSVESDIEEVKKLLIQIVSEDERVLKNPPPSLFVTDADITGIKISTYCWVKNGNWLSVRSDLWVRVQNAFINHGNIAMSRPQQEIFMMDKNKM